MNEEKIYVAIVDDEPPARTRLRNLLNDTPCVEIVAECCTGKQAIDCIQSTRIDLMFLDIQMPELTGIEILEYVDPLRMPEIVFVTAYSDWAIRAFEINAVDYLLKPFDNERFAKAFQRACLKIRTHVQSKHAKEVAHLLSQFRSQNPAKRILVKSSEGLRFVNVSDVISIQAAGKFVELICKSSTHLVRKSMKQVFELVGNEDFTRIHRSHIVNLAAVDKIEPYFHGDYRVTLTDGRVLPVSRNFKSNILNQLK